ncbi:asparagine synthase C-terminal domain-containing protein [Nocardia transvalensis]|uniref:asparagine synthase C-terminal domain-containing protein n=1 Tax=Nocardia transvalensis TaxID=37333 RepID=UPI001E3F9F8A|nr:asparagine synthase-related protein [Nocardia transvalensis]
MSNDLVLPPQTSEPIEYVTDVLCGMTEPNPDTRILADPEEVAEIIDAETRSRLTAVLERFGGTPAVLLSGGVDSIYVASVAVDLGYRPHAITIVTENESDGENAKAASRALGISHDVIRLTAGEVVDLAGDVIARLDTSELWEVTAGIPILASRRSLEKIPQLGAILSGGGADAILAGGTTLTYPLESADARAQLDRLARTESVSNFRYHRLVPHFYAALLEHYADNFVQTFQTVRWWKIAERFAPPALFGERNGQAVDKLALRIACDHRLPDGAKHLAWSTKSPIQRSSGLMGTLALAARTYAATLQGAQTYTDPLTEDPEAVATRLYLAILDRDRVRQI